MQLVVQPGNVPVSITAEGAERRMLSYGGGMMAVEFRFPAGVAAPIHQHPHQQIGYVVAGEIDFIMDGYPTQRLGPGATYYVPPDVRHGIVTHTPAVLFDILTPPREEFLGA
jgi:quercetin dioxygenase-like cupin family protein